jgi:hypothetical protein
MEKERPVKEDEGRIRRKRTKVWATGRMKNEKC